MSWLLWLFAGFAWLSVWAGVLAARASTKDGDEVIGTFGPLLPAFCATTCIGIFLLTPERDAGFHNVTLWVHHASIFLLFLFLTSAEYFQAEAWWRIRRNGPTRSVARCFRNLWILTETMPAPIALTIFLTGLRLIWELPEPNSPSHLWLLILIVGFSFFFWDGILGYQPIVRRIWDNWRRVVQSETVLPYDAQAESYTLDALQLFFHFVSWPFVFLVGFYRWSPPSNITRIINSLINNLRYLPLGWPEVIVAVLIWLIIGVVVFAARSAAKYGLKPKSHPDEVAVD